MSRQWVLVSAFVLVACGAGRTEGTSECLCAGDAAVEDSSKTREDSASTFDLGTDAGCDDKHVLVYPRAGCDVAPVCVEPADTACVSSVCGCDGKIHIDGCEGPQTPFVFRAGGGNDGDPCGDAGVDASSDG